MSKRRFGILRVNNLTLESDPTWLRTFLNRMEVENKLPALSGGQYTAATDFLGTHHEFDELEIGPSDDIPVYRLVEGAEGWRPERIG